METNNFILAIELQMVKTFLSQSRSKQKFHCNGFIDSIHFPQKSYFGKSNLGYVRLVKYQIYNSANKHSLVAYISIACMTFMKESDEVRKVKTSMFPKILFWELTSSLL